MENASKPGAFPHYDSIPKPEKQALVEVASSSNGDGYVSELQRAVNQARKAEQRVKKIAQEKIDRMTQWKSYEAELKKCYSIEKNRFRNAVLKLEKDESEAMADQASAREALRKVAIEPDADMHGPHMETSDRDFEMLLGNTVAEEVQEEDMDAVIQRAIAEKASMKHGSDRAGPGQIPIEFRTPKRPVVGMPSTPLGQRIDKAAVPMPPDQNGTTGIPHGASPLSGCAISDPYMTAVTPGNVGQRPSPQNPAIRHVSPASGGARARENLGVRTSVKESTKVMQQRPRCSPGLAEKLEARRAIIEEEAHRRQQEVQATGGWMGPPVPIAGSSNLSAPSAGSTAADGQGNHVPAMHILDDDFSDEDPAVPQVEQGLQTME